jgi:hypothetical protein
MSEETSTRINNCRNEAISPYIFELQVFVDWQMTPARRLRTFPVAKGERAGRTRGLPQRQMVLVEHLSTHQQVIIDIDSSFDSIIYFYSSDICTKLQASDMFEPCP